MTFCRMGVLMKTLVLAVALAVSISIPNLAFARGGGFGHSSGHSSHSSSHSSKAVPGVKRDSHGRIARSPQAKNDFKKSHPCPSTGKSSGACPGYVIDHVTSLKRGGADSPSNMQWQTTEAAKIKDRTE